VLDAVQLAQKVEPTVVVVEHVVQTEEPPLAEYVPIGHNVQVEFDDADVSAE
jgi:hypothetical protein